MTNEERAALMNKLALAAMRHRMSDDNRVMDASHVTERDYQFVLRFVRMSAPLHPLPEQPALSS